MPSEILIVSEDPSLLAKVSLRYIRAAKDVCVKAILASDFQTGLLKRKMLVVVDIRHTSFLRKILASCDLLQITTVTFNSHNLSGVEQSAKALSSHGFLRQFRAAPTYQPKPSVGMFRAVNSN